MRTFVAKPADAARNRSWWVIDAKGQPLGRLASRIAILLRGKHKPTFTPHVDTGDFVVVINASDVKVTGRKAANKMYYRHSGTPGHLKSEPFRHLAARRPDVPIRQAVKGMLPKNVLGRHLLGKLKIYEGAQHPHQAQKPKPLSP